MNAKTPKPAKPEPKPECNVDDCSRSPRARGLCDAHWATHRGLADPKEKL